MLFSLGAPVRVQPFFGWRNETCLRLTARALRSRPADFAAAGRWQAVRTMLSQFASHEVSDLSVELELPASSGAPATRVTGVTDGEGFVRFDVPLAMPRPRGKTAVWETAALHWSTGGQRQTAEASILVPGTASGTAIVSDIDDTVLETGVTGGLGSLVRNWRRILAELPDERLLVPGADAFYRALGGWAPLPGDPPPPGAEAVRPAGRSPVFYISSSPWNLFSYLVAFHASRNLPLGPLLLRDWGLNAETLGGKGHGAHKEAAITRLLHDFPDLRFILIGDDTQADLLAFAAVAAAHPGRVRAVFVRQAGEAHSAEEQAARAALTGAGVPFWMGMDYSAVAQFVDTLGLNRTGAAAKLAQTVAHPPAGKASPPAQAAEGEPQAPASASIQRSGG